MARERKPEYKPLLFTTTIRNPERIKFFIYVINEFDGKLVTDELATQIVGKAIQYGLYRPMKKTKKIKDKWKSTDSGEFAEYILSDEEVKWMLLHNPQKHKEAGYGKGWPSRFQTEFLFPKQLGLVYYAPGERIRITELGRRLLSCFHVSISNVSHIDYEEDQPENEQSVFIQAMAKYQRCNPLIKVLNDNVPLILLLQVVKKLDANPKYNDHKGKPKGISRKELPLLIFWKDNNAEKLYERIVKLRNEYKYDPSDEVIRDICTEEIMEGKFKKFDMKSMMQDYPDEFIRKMRITGLISLRGAGKFVDINSLEEKRVDYVLKTYSNYKHYDNVKNYFRYVSTIDENLFEIKSESISSSKSEELLNSWLEEYRWNDIKSELLILQKKGTCYDAILKFIPAPARLEFLTALSIKSKFPKVRVIPHYSCDDTGLPTSTAGGNQADIECFENNNGIIVEVTMAEGRTQTMMEIWPIRRHLEDFTKKHDFSINDTEAIFTAPSIYSDSKDQIEWTRTRYKEIIRPFTISQFSQFLETTDHLKQRVLTSIEDDKDVFNLIQNRLHINPHAKVTEITVEVQKKFGEKYSDMLPKAWFDLISSYLFVRPSFNDDSRFDQAADPHPYMH